MNLQENQSPDNDEDIPVCQHESMICFQMDFPWVKEKNQTISQHFASLDQIYLCCSLMMSTVTVWMNTGCCLCSWQRVHVWEEKNEIF